MTDPKLSLTGAFFNGSGPLIMRPVSPLEKEQIRDAGSAEYLELLQDMADLHRRKSAGYAGDSPDPWINFREASEFGVTAETGVLIRMSDKWSRIKSLSKNPANDKVGENLKDTLMDLAAYALIAICLINEQDDKNV